MRSNGHRESGADIALVCNSLHGGGIQRVVTNLSQGWAARGVRVCVITIRDQPDTYALAPAVQRVKLDKPVDEPYLLQRLRAAWAPVVEFKPILPVFTILRLRRQIIRSGADIVIGFGSNGAGPLTLLACRGLRKRVIVSERNDPSLQRVGPPWEKLRRDLYNKADIVTANSVGVLDMLAAFVDRNKLQYVPNPMAIPAHVNDPPETVANWRPYVLTVGRLHHQKAHDVLLRAFAGFASQFPEWHLVLVGDGKLRPALTDLSRELTIADRVHLVGYTRDPFPYYKSATVFALPSRHEGTPNALLEAMAFGLPCIVSDASPGPLELITPGETGLVVPVEQVPPLEAALSRLAEDPAQRARLGAGARERVTVFGIDRALDAWEEVIGLRP